MLKLSPGYRPPPLFSTRANAQVDDSIGPSGEQENDSAEEFSSHRYSTSDEPNLPAINDNLEFDSRPLIETEDDGAPLIGDLLKINFIEHKVVPTILVNHDSIGLFATADVLQDFFFRFPWNNFLHNVVYDVVQQVFNGPMDRGHNRELALDLFETGHITDRIIEGQKRSDEAQRRRQMRLGYMGHLTLIAEEVVKFAERQPTDHWARPVLGTFTTSAWVHYVENVLTETRNRDNAILGGMRPDTVGGPRQAMLNAVNAISPGFGNTGSAVLADAGLTGSGMPTVGKDTEELMNPRHDLNSGQPTQDGAMSAEFNNSDEKDSHAEDFGTGSSIHSLNDQDQVNNFTFSALSKVLPSTQPLFFGS